MQKILSKILLINECVESLDFERLPSLHIDNNWWESQSRVLVAKVLWAANNFWISVFALSLPDNDWSIFINLLFFSCSCWWTSLAELSHGLQRVREEMNKRLITAQRVKVLKWREGPTLYIFPSYQITAFILTRSIMRTKAKLILSWALRKRILVVNENSQLPIPWLKFHLFAQMTLVSMPSICNPLATSGFSSTLALSPSHSAT